MTHVDQARLTGELIEHMTAIDADVFGVADVGSLNEKSRTSRRPEDLFPQARAVIVLGCGMIDPLEKCWAGGGKETLSVAINELTLRKLKIQRFLRQRGWRTFGGEVLGGGLFHTGINLALACVESGVGYIGTSNLVVTEKYGPGSTCSALPLMLP